MYEVLGAHHFPSWLSTTISGLSLITKYVKSLLTGNPEPDSLSTVVGALIPIALIIF